MANKINSIRSNRQMALQIAGSVPSDEQLVTITATVVDDKTAEVQSGVTVYWGYQGVNEGVFRLYNTDKTSYNPNLGTTTGDDGTTSLCVGSKVACIGNITASLTQSFGERTLPGEKISRASTTIAIWTVGNGGGSNSPPAPVINEDYAVTIPTWQGGNPPPPQSALVEKITLYPKFSFSDGDPYVVWMCQGEDTTVLGQCLGIGTYNGESIAPLVPYADLMTGPGSANNVAYMFYSNRNPYPSQIYGPFTASGQALQRPDDVANPPDANLKPVQYVEADTQPPVIDTDPPTILTDSTFDLSDDLTITWAIPDYNDPNGELRVSTDKITVWAYANGWKPGGTVPNYNKVHLVDLDGSDFTNGYAFFTMLKSDWQKTYCPNNDTGLNGIIWIQYVINDEHYSQSMTTLINFCD